MKDIDMVEQVRRMATKVMKGMERMRYMEKQIAGKVEPGPSERYKPEGRELQ